MFVECSQLRVCQTIGEAIFLSVPIALGFSMLTACAKPEHRIFEDCVNSQRVKPLCGLLLKKMCDNNKKKQKRSAISLETKIIILDCLAKGERSTAIAAIRRSVRSGTNLSSKISSYSRGTLIEKTEKALVIWIEDLTQKRIPLDGHLIKMKALKFYKELKESEPSTSSRESNPQFSASTGWLTGFIKRHSFHNLKIKGEMKKLLENILKSWLKLLKMEDIVPIKSSMLMKQDCFGKKCQPEKNASGFKAAKDRVTLLLCSNASGDRMLKLLLVNRSLKPRALKGKDLNTLPVHWMANKKAWVTTAIFTEWFNKCFVPERWVLEFKILLILDNAPGHLNLEHPNIKVVFFFPPNTTSLIQPLDQGIISTFKKYYVKFTFQFIFDKLESDTITVTEVWKQFNILNCVDHVALAIAEIKSQTLNQFDIDLKFLLDNNVIIIYFHIFENI
ncbi:TIGD1 [Cordylochernes scorpioides]|uniref:TIGD1 n=1 Tax=Cordylochernes scorpioides TaxID=51811 RepID=A0ABY6KZU4_9ARAC|nr:TIGD1 [Cordylochernes scorpioides]